MVELSDFIIQPRGCFLFDFYIHPKPIQSVLGDFFLEFQVDDSVITPPSHEMLEVIILLSTAFKNDTMALALLVYQEYLLAVEDIEWCKECQLPVGLKLEEISPLLSQQTIGVSYDMMYEPNIDLISRGRVYMSPQWNEEHGLYVTRVNDKWEIVDI